MEDHLAWAVRLDTSDASSLTAPNGLRTSWSGLNVDFAVVFIDSSDGTLVAQYNGLARTHTPSPTPLIEGVPRDQTDGSSGSEWFEPAPAEAVPTISEEAARSKINVEAMGGNVMQVVLLNSIDVLHDPPDPPKLVWIGSIDPETFTAFMSGGACHCTPPGPVRTLYAYVVIDATTGEYLHTASSSYYETPAP